TFVRNGSRLESQYISTTRSLETAEEWATKDGCRIVAIDLKKIDYRLINDLSDKAARDAFLKNPVAKAFAGDSSEVIIDCGKAPNCVPANAILPGTVPTR